MQVQFRGFIGASNYYSSDLIIRVITQQRNVKNHSMSSSKFDARTKMLMTLVAVLGMALFEPHVKLDLKKNPRNFIFGSRVFEVNKCFNFYFLLAATSYTQPCYIIQGRF